MASVDEVGKRLAAVADQLPLSALRDAAEALEAAHQALSVVAAGSVDPELVAAVQQFEQAYQAAEERYQECRGIQAAVQTLVGKLGGGAPADTPGNGKAGGSGTSAGGEVRDRDDGPPKPSKPDGQRLTREEAVKLQGQLPPPVVSNTGAKTHGLWIDEHGKPHKIVSGQDEDTAQAWRILQARGIPAPAEPTTTSDVEQKLAARMVREGRKHLEVTLNNRPCRGVFGCDTLVPIILPEGYSLTVHAPNYKKTFTGGAKPW